MKLIVAGSRHIDDVEFIESVLDGIRLNKTIECVISGMARGPDTIGEEWAKKHGIPVMASPANWKKYGKAAGPIRNAEMAEIGDAVVAFWDGISTGTKDMCKRMVKMKKSIRIILMPSDDQPKKEFTKYQDHNTLDF